MSRTAEVSSHKFHRCYLIEDAGRYFESIKFQLRDYIPTPCMHNIQYHQELHLHGEVQPIGSTLHSVGIPVAW
jgi:hypothetical protein